MYDLIVIGGGPGGYEAANRAGELGKKTLLLEAQKIGGTCLHRGCIPAKTYLRYAHLSRIYRESPVFIHSENFAPDFSALISERERIINQLADGIAQTLKKNRVETIAALGEIISPGKIVADGKTFEAANILIATGSEPARPPISGGESADTSDSFWRMTSLPKSAAIIGGGVIGLEFAAFFSALKIPVTIIESAPRIAGTLDGEIAKRLRTAMKKNGVDFFVESRVVKIVADEIYFVSADGNEQKIRAEKIMIATGRNPRVANLGLEKIGVDCDRRGIKTNSRGQTSVAGIWAAGDVTGRCLLAHAAAREGIVAVENMFGGDREMRYDAMPSVIYTDPEVASVGVSEEQLRDENIAYQKISTPLAVSGRYAIEFPGQTGLIKILCADDDHRILGAQILGGAGGEIIHTFALLIAGKIPASQIRDAIFPHPTIAEALATALAKV